MACEEKSCYHLSMVLFRPRILFISLLCVVVFPVLSGAFIHPQQLLKNRPLSESLGRGGQDFNTLDFFVGNRFLADYRYQDLLLGLHYGLIRPQGISYRFDVGYFSNKNTSGSTLITIPVMANVIFGYPARARIDVYFGLGVGAITLYDAGSQMGLGYQWFSGLTLGLMSDMSTFAEYGRQYCVGNQNLDAEMLRFGLTFKFFPR